MRNLRVSIHNSNRSGHAIDPHLCPGSNVPNPGSRPGVRQPGHANIKLTVPHLAAIVGSARVLRLSSSLYGCATRTAGSKSAGECGAPTSRCLELESRMLGRMVRFDSSTPCKAAHIVLTALSRRVQRTHRREHRSTRRTRQDIVSKILHNAWHLQSR